MGTAFHSTGSQAWVMAWLPLLLDAAVKGVLVLAVAGALCLLLRRASAASRHLIWCVALAQVMALPLLSLMLPAWRLPLLPPALAAVTGYGARVTGPQGQPAPAPERPASAPSRLTPRVGSTPPALTTPPSKLLAPTAVESTAAPPAGMSAGTTAAPLHWWMWVLLVWATGLALAAAPVLLGLLSLHLIARRVRPLTDDAWTALLQSLSESLSLRRRVRLCQTEHVSVPMTWGIWHPIILLPTDAENWSEERRRLVLLHELAHIQRADCLTQLLAQTACALYWFNPLTWLAARQLRVERERACDDRVLQAGARASDYAQHLLEIARGARGASCAALAAVAMARPSQLEGRLLAVLDASRSRRTVSRLAALAAVVAGCGAVLPLAALEAAARGGQSARSAVVGAQGRAAGMAARRVLAGRDADNSVAPSPDGRYLSFVDQETGDLAIRDLATGKTRRLTNKGSRASYRWEGAYRPRISPDGKQVAYAWFNKDRSCELRLIGLQGSRPRMLHRSEAVNSIFAADWSKDGKQILASFHRKDGTVQMVLVSVADGSVRVLKSADAGRLERMSLSPDGRTIAYDYRLQADAPERDIYLLATDGSGEIPLDQHPADEMDPLWTPDGKGVVFLSDRTGSLGVWIAAVAGGKPQGSPELVKRDMGTAFAIGMTRNGSLYYGLEAGMLDVYVATLDPVTGKLLAPPQSANPRQVGRNTSPSWSPDGRSLAYLSPDRSWLRVGTGGGSHNISIRSVESGETREIALKAGVYQPSWSPDGRSLLAAGGPTGARRIDVQTGAMTPVPEAVRSMWEGVWAPDGKALFYSTAAEVVPNAAPGAAVIRVRDLETKREKELYRGSGSPWNLILSSDGTQLAFLAQEPGTGYSSLQVIPAAGGEVRELLRVKEPESITTIAWMPDGRHLLFGRGNMAKTDPRGQAAELYRIAAGGGEPQPLGLAMKHLRELRVHPDGRRIAFTAGLGEMEIWVLEHFLPAAPTAREAAK